MTTYPSSWDDLLVILRLGPGAAKDVLLRYYAFLVRWVEKFLVAGLIVTVLLIVLAVTNGGPAWVLSLGALALGVLGTAAVVLAAPLLWAFAALQDLPQIRRVLNWITLAAFASIIFAIASQILPLWQNPDKLLLLVLLICGAVLGARVGLVLIPKAYVARVITVTLILLFLFAIVGLVAPSTLSWLRNLIGSVEPLPKALVIDLSADAPIRDPESRRPAAWTRIWFVRRSGGAFELFNRSGLDPGTGVQLEYLDTPQERTALLEWIQGLRDKERIQIQAKADSMDRAVAERKRLKDSVETAQIRESADSAREADNVGRAIARELVQRAHDDSVARTEARARAIRASQESLSTEIKAVEALARVPPPRAFDARPEWKQELADKSISIEFSSLSRRLAAAFLNRLRNLGVEVTLAPVLVGTRVATPAIEYTQAEIHAAEALSAILGDLAKLDLNSHRAVVPLRILLP